jgi:hypothetical protein
LTDFGFTRNLGAVTVVSIAHRPKYITPEMFAGEIYTNVMDVRGFGILLRTLSMKQLPYYEQSAEPSEIA